MCVIKAGISVAALCSLIACSHELTQSRIDFVLYSSSFPFRVNTFKSVRRPTDSSDTECKQRDQSTMIEYTGSAVFLEECFRVESLLIDIDLKSSQR